MLVKTNLHDNHSYTVFVSCKSTYYFTGSAQISLLAKHIQPHYHFAATENMFYQRLPYKNDDTPYPTRFIGLAAINDSQEKHKKVF